MADNAAHSSDPAYDDEFKRCWTSCEYFIEHYVPWIRLTSKQKGVIWRFQNHSRAAYYADRAAGKTTCIALFLLWKSIFYPNTYSVFLSQAGSRREHIYNMLIDHAKKLPEWMNVNLKEDLRYRRIYLGKGSAVKLTTIGTADIELIKGRHIDIICFEELPITDYESRYKFYDFLLHNILPHNENPKILEVCSI